MGASLGLFECVTDGQLQMEAKFQNHMAEFGLSYITADEFNFRMSLFAAKDACMDY